MGRPGDRWIDGLGGFGHGAEAAGFLLGDAVGARREQESEDCGRCCVHEAGSWLINFRSMNYRSGNQIREDFLRFFEGKGHQARALFFAGAGE